MAGMQLCADHFSASAICLVMLLACCINSALSCKWQKTGRAENFRHMLCSLSICYFGSMLANLTLHMMGAFSTPNNNRESSQQITV